MQSATKYLNRSSSRPAGLSPKAAMMGAWLIVLSLLGCGRPAHRCRHGRTSSRHRWTSPIKNIYAREDQAVVFLEKGDITLADLPTILEAHQLVIWCDHHAWRLEVDGNTVLEQTPPRMAPIPKQRMPRLTAKTPPEDQAASMEAVGK